MSGSGVVPHRGPVSGSGVVHSRDCQCERPSRGTPHSTQHAGARARAHSATIIQVARTPTCAHPHAHKGARRTLRSHRPDACEISAHASVVRLGGRLCLRLALLLLIRQRQRLVQPSPQRANHLGTCLLRHSARGAPLGRQGLEVVGERDLDDVSLAFLANLDAHLRLDEVGGLRQVGIVARGRGWRGWRGRRSAAAAALVH